MKYYRALTDGEIAIGPMRVSWLYHGYHQIAARCYDSKVEYGCGCGYYYHFWQRNSEFFPNVKEFGECVEITEQEAMQLDPGLFEDHVIWDNYESFKPHDAMCEAERCKTKVRSSKARYSR
jgi:hypothetical protein